MRFQDIYHTIKNPVVIKIAAMWGLVGAVGIFSAFLWIKAIIIQDEHISLKQQIEILTKKRSFLESDSIEMQVEDIRLTMILVDLLEARKQSNIHLMEASVSDEVLSETYARMPLTVTLRGTYNQIGMFVNALEKKPRFKIIEVNLSTKQKKRSGIIGEIKADFIRI
jgi:Tfp pilus assembly protein PilO